MIARESTILQSGGQTLHDRDALHSIRHALVARMGPSARLIHCELQRGELVLSGLVESFYQKQLAQESVFSTGTGYRVRNRIAVDYPT